MWWRIKNTESTHRADKGHSLRMKTPLEKEENLEKSPIPTGLVVRQRGTVGQYLFYQERFKSSSRLSKAVDDDDNERKPNVYVS